MFVMLNIFLLSSYWPFTFVFSLLLCYTHHKAHFSVIPVGIFSFFKPYEIPKKTHEVPILFWYE